MQNPDGAAPGPLASDEQRLSLGARVSFAVAGSALACVVVAALAQAEPRHVTQLFGGAGGKPQGAYCKQGQRVIGVDVATAMNAAAGVRVICADGSQLAPLGQMLGPVTELRCPSGWSVIGLWGAVGSYVDAISVSCAPNDDARGPIRHLALAGANGGWGFHARCAHGHADGFDARTGAVVDAIGLHCVGDDD